MSEEESNKRTIDQVEPEAEGTAESTTPVKKAKVDEAETETAAADAAPAAGEAAPAAAAPASYGIAKKKREFSDLPAAIQALFNATFTELSITANDLDTCVYDSLCDFPLDVQNEIVSSFCRADLTTIRNKTGYLIGILKQYRKNGKAVAGGGMATPAFGFGGMPGMPPFPGYPGFPPAAAAKGPKPPAGSGVAGLPASVGAKFRALFATGTVTEAELDTSIFDSLHDFDEQTAGSIVERYASSNLSTVRNKTGYFISLLKLARQARDNGQGFAASRDSPAPPMYGGYQPPPMPQQHAPPAGYDPAWAAYYAQQAQQAPHDPYGGAYAQQQQQYYGAPQQQQQQQQASPALGGQVVVPMSFYKISQQAQTKLAALYNTFMLTQSDIEDCVFDSLADFSEADQITMVDSFSQAQLMSVRNKTAFFIGILKRHRAGGAR